MPREEERTWELEQDARDLLAIMRRQARRAWVLELTGTPKAGKTTSVTTLRRFFEHCGYRVHLLQERAADCPLPMKGHFFFNTWTTCTMLAEVLATVNTDVDLLVLDRGFFDALIWLELQATNGQVKPEEKSAFEAFVKLDRWRNLVDTTVVMRASADQAISRENQHLIRPREGSVMNPAFLSKFNEALQVVQERESKFFHLISFESNINDIVADNTALIAQLLPLMREWADPDIAAIPRNRATQIFSGQQLLRHEQAVKAWTDILSAVEVRKRSVFEADSKWIQLVACGFLDHEDGGFVFKREPHDSKSKQYGSHTLWKGCHVECQSTPTIAAVQNGLVRRIQDDLHLAIELSPDLAGIAWDPSDQHLGLLFRVNIPFQSVAESMKEKRYRSSGRQKTLVGQYLKKPELNRDRAAGTVDLEPWSKHYLDKIAVAS
jgi:predicted NUDIX family phosphoesterase/predicted ATPase